MRRSHEGILGIKKDNYPGLPDILKEFNYYYQDYGHVIMAIPEVILNEAIQNGDLDMFECPVPCKYILEHGFRIYNNHVIIDCVYDNFNGVVIDSFYYEEGESTDNHEDSVLIKTAGGEPFFIPVKQEGMFFDTDEKGANLIISFISPTQNEIEQFSSSIKTKFNLSVVDDILFVLAKIGKLNWMDASYNPLVASSLKPLSIDMINGSGISVWIYLVDTKTNILKAQKLVVLGTEFSKDFQNIVNSILAKNKTVSDFNYRLQNIYRKYTTTDLLDFSKSCYVSGEK